MTDYSEPRPGIITLPLLDTATCGTIIDLCNEQDGWRQAGVVGQASQGHNHVATELRSATLHAFRQGSPVWNILHPKIDTIVRPLVRQRWHRDFAAHSEFQVVRYHPGDFYKRHRDSGPYNAERYFSVVFYLNDDFEGGGTYFPDADYTVVPKKGTALIFPSDYLHQAVTVEDGTKYIAVTWMLGKPPIQWI